MTDDLRDRISVTQQAHIFRITECSCGHRFPWEKSTEWRERAEWAWARHVADAVIRELERQPPGLQRDGSFIDATGMVWRHTGKDWTDDPDYRP